MGRPGLALGTAGKIRLHASPSGHRAVAWYRDYDGKCRQVERNAKTKAAAEAALRLALRDRARFDVGGDITSNTRVSVLAEAWFAGLKNLSPTTMQALPLGGGLLLLAAGLGMVGPAHHQPYLKPGLGGTNSGCDVTSGCGTASGCGAGAALPPPRIMNHIMRPIPTGQANKSKASGIV